jgi:hypothetical protein
MHRADVAFASLAPALREATAAIERLRPHLVEAARWYRFDTVTGPLIGAAVILGTLGIAALAAWGAAL